MSTDAPTPSAPRRLLYRFCWEVRRGSDIIGMFVSDEATIKEALGKRVYLGEANGKHSEVYGPLEEADLTVLTDDQAFIVQAEAYGLVPTGWNPLEYLPECC